MSVKIAVLTDLHAFDPEVKATGAPPSWLRTDGRSKGGPLADPFRSLDKLIEDAGDIRADFLLCAGDLTDKAQPGALSYVWKELGDLADRLGAELVATSGNHDLDSRNALGGVDPKQLLQRLRPKFPTPDEGDFNKYWAQHYVVLDRPNCRFVVLNSAARHGYGGDHAKDIYEQGHVGDETIEAIAEELTRLGHRDRNVLLCHHHPMRRNRLYELDSSEMINGEKLLDALHDVDVGDWLVVHGHRHCSNLFYAGGGSASPTILSAGSFSVSLPPALSYAQNEFYVLELDDRCDGPLRGTLQTWTWQMGAGWHSPVGRVGLPPQAGFGARIHPVEMAARVRAIVSETPLTPVKWSAVEIRLPELKYSLPVDVLRTADLLERSGVGISRSAYGLPSELQLRP